MTLPNLGKDAMKVTNGFVATIAFVSSVIHIPSFVMNDSFGKESNDGHNSHDRFRAQRSSPVEIDSLLRSIYTLQDFRAYFIIDDEAIARRNVFGVRLDILGYHA